LPQSAAVRIVLDTAKGVVTVDVDELGEDAAGVGDGSGSGVPAEAPRSRLRS